MPDFHDRDPHFERAKFVKTRANAILRRLHQWQARRKHHLAGKVIGVTGSVGKTTATHMLTQMLHAYGSVRSTVKENTEYYLLRTVRHLRQPIDYIVLEVSGHKTGHIARVLETLRFDGAIVTTIGQDHWSAFHSLDDIATEKGTLVAGVLPTGFVCLNADDPRVLAMAARTEARVITFGRSEGADLRAVEVGAAWPNRLRFVLEIGGQRHPVATQMVMSTYLPSILGALAAVHGLGLDLGPAIEVLATAKGADRRTEPRRGADGHTYLLDTSKASLWSTEILMDLLPELGLPDLILVIGEISDTRNDSSRRYRKLIRGVAGKVGTVVGVGPAASPARKVAAEGVTNVFAFDRREEVTAFLATRPPGVVFLKGSSGFDLDRIVPAAAGASDPEPPAGFRTEAET